MFPESISFFPIPLRSLQYSDSQPGVILFPSEHVAMAGDIFGVYHLGIAIGIQWVEVRDTVKHLTMSRIPLQHRLTRLELSIKPRSRSAALVKASVFSLLGY